MKKKTTQAVTFINELHESIISDRTFRAHTGSLSEVAIQRELRPLILRYLEDYFRAQGLSDPSAKAYKEFYWEGQEGQFGESRPKTFGARNYPDFIVKKPYRLAIEYKQSANGSIVKQGIGQSMLHTLSGDFDFVYYLFHDQSPDKSIETSGNDPKEKMILKKMKNDFNVFIYFA